MECGISVTRCKDISGITAYNDVKKLHQFLMMPKLSQQWISFLEAVLYLKMQNCLIWMF